MAVTTPHFSVPFRVVDGSVSVVDQDTEDEITQSVAVIARYPRGIRTDLPEFGCTDQTFRRQFDPLLLAEEIEEWEQRLNGSYTLTVDESTQTVTVTRKDA